jgi:UDP-N-acetylmuramyl-tripeptide synthetase
MSVQQILGTSDFGYIGTNGVSFQNHIDNIPNTTPVPKTLYRFLDNFRKKGARGAVLELSSEGKAAGRLNDLEFDCIGLTNLTSEHLNTHKTLENYLAVKTSIFLDNLKPHAIAVLNADDSHFRLLADEIRSQRPDISIQTYGYAPELRCKLQSQSSDSSQPKRTLTLEITNFQLSDSKTVITFKYNNREYQLTSPLLGLFNIENLSCALLVANSQSSVLEHLPESLPQLQPQIDSLSVPGRMEIFQVPNRPTVIVDYAHTPNGITRLFESLPQLGKFHKIYSVSGQAGSRDSSKRAQIGRLLANNSTEFIITTEDPHWEDYQNVVEDLISQIELSNEGYNYKVILDRYQAIEYAIDQAQPGDLVLVLGKGAEQTHSFKGVDIPFSDIETVQTFLGLSN